jgi:hypothetical protein
VGSISHILHQVLYYLQSTGCRDPKPSFLSAVAVDQPWREAVQYFLALT